MSTSTGTTTPTANPTTVAELRDAVLDHPGTLRLAGAGTAHDWAGEPAPADAVVDLRGLHGVVVHNPGDMTVEVHAGTPLTELQGALGEYGQRVAFDAARVRDGATVGGLFATADAGPLALAQGSLRDLVIGATVVLADGTTARSGGHVIKNVAGYDLTKLLHGAHGTFAAIASMVLRLHPVPATTVTLALPCARADLGERGRPIVESRVEVSALEWHEHPETGGRLLARIEGTEQGAPARAERLLGDVDGAEQLSPDAADAAWAAHADAVAARSDGAVLRLGVAPTRLAPLLDELEAAVGALSAVTAAPGTGVATVTVPATVEAVTAAHDAVGRAGGTSVLRQRPASAGGTALPAFPAGSSTAGLLRALSAAVDPDHRFGRGRLAPWLDDATRGGRG